MIKKEEILLNNSVVQGKGNIVSDMGGEKVMLSVHNGKYYNLGEIGGKIWDIIEKPILVTQLVTELRFKYEVERSVCEEQVVSFLGVMLMEGLINVEEVISYK